MALTNYSHRVPRIVPSTHMTAPILVDSSMPGHCMNWILRADRLAKKIIRMK